MTVIPAVAEVSTRSAFMDEYRCTVVSVLQEIHWRGPIGISHNRFMVLSMQDKYQRYVQCIFIERDTAMYCEASSGAYGADDPSLTRYIPTQETRDTLHQLGFTQDDPKENFSLTLPLGSPPDFERVAELMLATLYDAYGATRENNIEIYAPKGGGAHRKCGAPTS